MPRPLSDPAVGNHAIPLYSTDKLSRAQWKKLRKQQRQLGASDVAAVLHLDPNITPLMAQHRILGLEADDDELETSVGIMVEPLGMRVVAARYGLGVRRVPIVLKHPRIPLTCNLDSILSDGTPLEMKWCTRWMWREWDEFREHRDIFAMQGSKLFCHYIQVQSQLAVLGPEKKSGMLACICGEDAALRLMAAEAGFNVHLKPDDIIAHEFPRNEELIAEIESQVERFYYWHIEKRMPAPVTRAVDLALIRKSLGKPRAEIERRDDLVGPLEELRKARAAASDAAERAELLEAKFIAALGRIGEYQIGPYRIGARQTKGKNPRFYWWNLDPKKDRKKKLGTEDETVIDDDDDSGGST